MYTNFECNQDETLQHKHTETEIKVFKYHLYSQIKHEGMNDCWAIDTTHASHKFHQSPTSFWVSNFVIEECQIRTLVKVTCCPLSFCAVNEEVEMHGLGKRPFYVL